MLTSYIEQIRGNLDRLLKVALFHPRIALAGLGAELELVVREMIPLPLLQESVDRFRAKDFPYPDTAAMRDEIRNLSYSNPVRPHLGVSIRKLCARADQCRHERVDVSFDEVTDAISSVRAFIDAMYRGCYTDAFHCPVDKNTEHYVPAKFFDAEPGSTVSVDCRRCGTILCEVKVPSPYEWAEPYMIGEDLWEWAVGAMFHEIQWLARSGTGPSDYKEILDQKIKALRRLLRSQGRKEAR
jgi:hypothetical protein